MSDTPTPQTPQECAECGTAHDLFHGYKDHNFIPTPQTPMTFEEWWDEAVAPWMEEYLRLSPNVTGQPEELQYVPLTIVRRVAEKAFNVVYRGVPRDAELAALPSAQQQNSHEHNGNGVNFTCTLCAQDEATIEPQK